MSLTIAESDACHLVPRSFGTWATKGHRLQEFSKVKSWLYTTLYRVFLESRRRFTRVPHLELTEAEADLPSVQQDAVSRLDAQDVLHSVLQIPLGTVKSRIARGVARLKGLVLRKTSSPGEAKEDAA